MIVCDTSAWVEFLRGTGSPVDEALAGLVATRRLLVPDVVRLELLAGAGSDERAVDLQRLLARYAPSPTSSPGDHDVAAGLYRRARRSGQTVRSLLDCLVAAHALREDAELLARDRDFAVLAAISPLRLHPAAVPQR